MHSFLVTTIKRMARIGEAHGQLLSCNLAKRQVNVLNVLDSPLLSANPRGGDRGYRGVAVDQKRSRIILASAKNIHIFNFKLEPVRVLDHPLFQHLHDIAIAGDTCWICATGSDCIIEMSLITDEVQAAYRVLNHNLGAPHLQCIKAPWQNPQTSRYSSHLNSVYPADDGIYFSGARAGLLFNLTALRTLKLASTLPIGAHNATIHNGVGITLDTEADRVLIQRNNLKSIPLPVIQGHPKRTSRLSDGNSAASRAYFARGMDVSNEYITFGYSPISLCQISRQTYAIEDHWTITDDISWGVTGITPLPPII